MQISTQNKTVKKAIGAAVAVLLLLSSIQCDSIHDLPKRWVISESGLIIRKMPNVKSEKLGLLQARDKVYLQNTQKDKVTIGGFSGNWVQIVHENEKKEQLTGWVFDAWLTDTEPTGEISNSFPEKFYTYAGWYSKDPQYETNGSECTGVMVIFTAKGLKIWDCENETKEFCVVRYIEKVGDEYHIHCDPLVPVTYLKNIEEYNTMDTAFSPLNKVTLGWLNDVSENQQSRFFLNGVTFYHGN